MKKAHKDYLIYLIDTTRRDKLQMNMNFYGFTEYANEKHVQIVLTIDSKYIAVKTKYYFKRYIGSTAHIEYWDAEGEFSDYEALNFPYNRTDIQTEDRKKYHITITASRGVAIYVITMDDTSAKQMSDLFDSVKSRMFNYKNE